MTELTWFDVKSSTIQKVAWTPNEVPGLPVPTAVQAGSLWVAFTSGGVYRYLNVPEASYRDLLTTPSPGGYLHSHIKPRHECQRVPDMTPTLEARVVALELELERLGAFLIDGDRAAYIAHRRRTKEEACPTIS